jgi:hypothetical protein
MALDPDARMDRLERQLRTLKAATAGLAVLAIILATIPRPQAQQPTDTLRVRKLVVEDATGKERVVLGYLDAPGNNQRMGLRINDPIGAERFGLSYMENGRLVMGLDAPPNLGQGANRERITMVADETGSAYIRFMDRRSGVVSRMYLDEQDRFWVQFSDFSQKPAQIRRYGLAGEEIIRPQP